MASRSLIYLLYFVCIFLCLWSHASSEENVTAKYFEGLVNIQIKTALENLLNVTAELKNKISMIAGKTDSSTTEPPLDATGFPINVTAFPMNVTGFPINVSGSILNATLSVINVTGLPMNVSESVLNVTVSVPNVTAFPQNATETPLNVTGLPMNVTELPLNMTDIPQNVTEFPQNATENPLNATGTPLNVTGLPMNVTELPLNTTEIPQNCTEFPQNGTEFPQNATEYPLNVTETSWNATEFPLNVTETPWNATEFPLNVTETPWNATEFPLNVTGYPLNVTRFPGGKPCYCNCSVDSTGSSLENFAFRNEKWENEIPCLENYPEADDDNKISRKSMVNKPPSSLRNAGWDEFGNTGSKFKGSYKSRQKIIGSSKIQSKIKLPIKSVSNEVWSKNTEYRSPHVDAVQKFRQKLLHDGVHSNVTLTLEVDGNIIEILLDLIKPSRVMSGTKVTIKDERSWKRYKMSNIMGLKVYEGQVKNANNSYAVGSILHGVYAGIVILPDSTTLFVEPTKKYKDKLDRQNFIFYRETNVELPRCSKSNNQHELCNEARVKHSHFCKREGSNKIMCYHGSSENEFAIFPTPSIEDNIILKRANQRPRLDTVRDTTCTVKLISDPSHFVHKHNRSVHHALRELLVAFLQVDHALSSSDLDGDGKPEHLRLRLLDVDLYGDFPSSHKKGNVMQERVELMQREAPEYCASIMFLNENLPGEPISITFGGGVCGRTDNEPSLPENVAVINTRQSEDSDHFLLTLSRLTTQTLGQMMGSVERKCDNTSEIYNWGLSYSDCQRRNMGKVLATQGFCLEARRGVDYRSLWDLPNEVRQVCGDGIVQVPEECDCGTLQECKMKEHCCIPPGVMDECKIDREKGYECDKKQRCCTGECKLVPQSEHLFCGLGNPACTSQDAYCNGKFAQCPVTEDVAAYFNGRDCGDHGTCKDGICNETMCGDDGRNGSCYWRMAESTSGEASIHYSFGVCKFQTFFICTLCTIIWQKFFKLFS